MSAILLRSLGVLLTVGALVAQDAPSTNEERKAAGLSWRFDFPRSEAVLIEGKRPEPTPTVLPSKYGDCTGTAVVAHRAVIKGYSGWGWIKRERDPWRKAEWVYLNETVLALPGRFLAHPDDDDGIEYRLYGEWLPDQAYESNRDTWVPVFRLRGFEVIGKAERPMEAPNLGPKLRLFRKR